MLFLLLICAFTSSKGQNSTDTIFYQQSRIPREIITYNAQGVKSTRCAYYPSGMTMFAEYYKNGILNQRISYYANGAKEAEYNFSDGLSNGSQLRWYDTGIVKSISNCNLDSCSEIAYYENGAINYYASYYEGRKYYMKELCKNGQIIHEFFINGKVNTYTQYRCDGSTYIVGYLRFENVMVGKFTQYYENGNVEISGQYLDSGENTFESIETGEWLFFNEKGTVIEIRKYDDYGKLIFVNKF